MAMNSRGNDENADLTIMRGYENQMRVRECVVTAMIRILAIIRRQ